MRAAGHLGRGDRHGDAAPALLDVDRIARAGDDQQMAVRRIVEDVPPLVAEIGANAAADVRPALGDVRDRAGREHRRRDRAVPSRAPTPLRRFGAIGAAQRDETICRTQRKGAPGCLPAQGASPKRKAEPCAASSSVSRPRRRTAVRAARSRPPPAHRASAAATLASICACVDRRQRLTGDRLDVDLLDRLQRGTDRRLDPLGILPGAANLDGMGVDLAHRPLNLGPGLGEVAASSSLSICASAMASRISRSISSRSIRVRASSALAWAIDRRTSAFSAGVARSSACPGRR